MSDGLELLPYPVLAWLKSNGVMPETVAFEPVTVVDGTIVYYRTYWFDEEPDVITMHGDQPLYRQMVVPLVVPPPPGLLASAARALRRAMILDLLTELTRGAE